MTTNANTEELNNRIFTRNLPSTALQPSFSIMPVSTKYSKFHVLDRQTDMNSSNQSMPFNVESTFNPGTRNAPWSGYASNVDKESQLMNRFFALQKCDQKYYVPSSNSDMYHTKTPQQEYNYNHSRLFDETPKFTEIPNDISIGSQVFNHSSRMDKNKFI